MKKQIAKQIKDLIDDYQKKADITPIVRDNLIPKPLSGFHQWADSKEFEGGFLIGNHNSSNIWFLLIKWNEENDFYVVLFPENKSGPIAEIHEVVSEGNELLFKWRYKPSKRDGKNEERKAYFAKYFLGLEVFISIPEKVDEVSDFLTELLSLSENRKKADRLDSNTPDFRDSFPEGKLKERLHKQRERSSALVKTVKEEAFVQHGKLDCQCCGFDFDIKYGELGREFIEAHHTKPVSELHQDGEKTQKKDIALVCANCHRMLHRKRPWLKMNELKKLTNAYTRTKSVYECFNEWRKENYRINNWGLAWFLANEFCKRFYSSHGIIPQVISHEGLGYYGIQINRTQCTVNRGNKEELGRFTMFGNVENWSTGGPGDHGLKAVEICENGENIEAIVKKAIFHMRIPEIPAKTHLNCRHKRWGTSYQLLFEIATILAIKYDHETIEIWNHPYHTQGFIDELDPKSTMNEHLGAFLFRYKDTKIIFASDGRELSGKQDDNYWHRYMSGESQYDLFKNLSQKLKL